MEWFSAVMLGLIFSMLFFERSKGLSFVEKGMYLSKIICMLIGVAVYLSILFFVIVILGFKALGIDVSSLIRG